MPQYRVQVTRIKSADAVPDEYNSKEVEVFSQTFPDTEFDLNTLVLALNKKRRVRKARGKEQQ